MHGKRHAEAIAGQLFLHTRRSKAAVSYIQRFWDVDIVFLSPGVASVIAFLGFFDPLSRQLVPQHITTHKCKIAACDGDIWLLQRSGVPQGHSIAMSLFNCVYWNCIVPFDASADNVFTRSSCILLLAPSQINALVVIAYP